ncbi:S-layer homology domain-containing protein [Paenibacillus sp. 453mf]|uniref:S-layer homology domain-containing protein n=1 Tax=Paenibacillus sp. 453mf TaxID=1761874 RepID=UPI0008DF838A|nr:S-layer homology domain-containing protein [Paenibacillus sp. 453mf]SFS85570.1 S-layer homology domain-containing protein [Paenibacillus sp. 453mf]
MQRIKRPMVWLLLVTLIVSLFPPGLVNKAEAADNVSTSYFAPDIETLKNTVQLKLEGTDKLLSRDNAYKVTEKMLTVTGTYTKVTGSTLSASIQQLTWDPLTSKWTRDTSKVTPGTIQLDLDSPDNRFTSTLTLYPGMNEITFSGTQGNMTRSESFYVLFDQVPYVESLSVLGLSQPVTLNEGTQVVIPRKDITLQGKIQNATRATIALNGGSALATTLLSDGTFYSPQLSLNPGLNNIVLVIENGSDRITVNHSLYYFDTSNPIVSMYLADSSLNANNLLTGTPTWTGAEDTATLYVQALVPDEGDAVSKSIKLNGIDVTPVYFSSLSLDSSGKLVTAGNSDVVIQGVEGATSAYRLITFAVPNFPFLDDASGTTAKSQRHSLNITYGSTMVNKAANFNFAQGEVVISQLYHLKGYTVGTDGKATYSKENLNGANVDSSDFYISVKTNSPVTDPNALTAKYLPVGSNMSISYVGPVEGSTTEYIYRISGFQNGNQTVRFQYSGSTQYKDAVISFVSKTYIYVSNLTDGQTVTIDSNQTTNLQVSGEYIGFDLNSTAFKGEVFVNGTTPAGLGTSWLTNGKFNLNLQVNADSGPLYYGENRIVFTGTVADDNNQYRVVRKEIRVYILDENVSNIDKFQPAVGNNRVTFPLEYTDNEQWAKIFNLTPDFIYNGGTYTTSLQEHDIVIRGNGASKVNLNLGSQNLFSLDVTDTVIKQTSEFTYNNKTYAYEYFGSSAEFVIRVQNLPAETPGTYVYNLELINSTGAKTSQQLQLVREVKPYRLLAPQPTVDGAYVVNKNFVRFDIEAEGATEVLIDGEPAVKRTDLGDDRFLYDYVGLKQDKANDIDIEIVRGSTTLEDTISVYYTGAVAVDSQYMAPKVANKYSVFNKSLELEFPKGTIMQSTDTRGINKYYPTTQLLFGLADPKDGVVERRNDYGNIIGFPNNGLSNDETGLPVWDIPDEYFLRFGASSGDKQNFTTISNVYWISGGLGERGTLGSADYLPPTNGLAPYSIEGLYGDPTIAAEREVTPSQRGELTLTYNSSVVDEVGSTITVFKYTSDREWVNVGGIVDAKNHTITVPFDEFGYYVVMKLSRSYTDITNHNWARNVLNAMYSKGLMENIRFDQFGTDDRTSRGEFATLLVKGMNLPLNYDNNQTFVDLVPGARSETWDYEHIETAARAGIVTGLTEGVFAPSQPLTREQAAVMIARAMKLKLAANDSKLTDNLAKLYVDSGSINYYAKPAVLAVNKAKIMTGNAITVAGQSKPQYSFNPQGFLTRAEAAKIAVELFKKSNKLFPNNLS